MNRYRVLCVDDEPHILKSLRRVLHDRRIEVVTAAGGEEALRALAAAPPDLVILDVAMPGMDGYEALARIRAASDVPVVMMTGHARLREVIGPGVEPPDSYIRKPTTAQEIRATVWYLLKTAA